MYSQDTLKKSLGQKIQAFRKTHNITQDEFAARIGVSRPSLSQIESGIHGADLQTLANIATVTKMDLNELLNVNQKKIAILDTNIILNRPQSLNIFIANADAVYIPDTVIEEINYQKDHAKNGRKANASLCEAKIIEAQKKHPTKIRITKRAERVSLANTNDDKILQTAIQIANENQDAIAYLITDDKDFLLKTEIIAATNLHVVGSQQAKEAFLPNESEFDPKTSQQFFYAVRAKDRKEAEELSKRRSVDVNFMDEKSGFTPLIQAVRNRDIQMIRFLLSLPTINMNEVDKKKYSFPPITHAVQIKNIEIIRMLLEAGADADAPSQDERNPFNTALMVSAWSGSKEIAELLLRHGACINQQDKGNGFTPLIKATFNNQPNLVRFLIKKGADKAVRSFENKTALDYAQEKNSGGKYKEIIRILEGNDCA